MVIEITEYTTQTGDIYQKARLGGGYMSFQKNRTGKQPHFKGNIKINEMPLEVVGWWKNHKNSDDKYISLSVSFVIKKQSEPNGEIVDIEVIPSEVLTAMNLPSDFNKSVQNAE